jgi:hypothetical protein
MNDKDTHVSWMFTFQNRLLEAYAYSRMNGSQTEKKPKHNRHLTSGTVLSVVQL